MGKKGAKGESSKGKKQDVPTETSKAPVDYDDDELLQEEEDEHPIFTYNNTPHFPTNSTIELGEARCHLFLLDLCYINQLVVLLRGTARPKIGANINLGCVYLVGIPVAVGLGFYLKLDFQGLWLGLLAAQASCAVTVLIVIARTNWEVQAERAKELTAGAAVFVDQFVEEEKPLKAENNDYSLC
ncbi:hypothetical protein POM88_010682 [Heracleum sosnowskyi]|uniref:Uncharacterized protein n=1 Tax=Heracleum sosnowskyi TaxID=360622 RepID=A0AAD8ITZ0_9APIA|nr:hypothetical protein POM88_010682 [Heracleum sosnowskyi]